MQSDQAICIADPEHAITSLDDSTRIHVVKDGDVASTFLSGAFAGQRIPLSVYSQADAQTLRHFRVPAMQVLTVDAGRGALINEGQIITAGVLKGLLAGILSETEFTNEFNLRLGSFDDSIAALNQSINSINSDLSDNSDIVALINAQLESAVFKTNDRQEGIATHGDTVTLDFTWPKPPLIDLTSAPGQTLVQTMDSVTDPTFDFIEIPNHEIIFGHGGIEETATPDTYRFAVSAAILEYEAPSTNNLSWTSADVLGSVALGLDRVSNAGALQNTVADCMGLEISGSLTLRNSGGTKVSGTAYAEMSVDGSGWKTIARFYRLFQANEPGALTKHFKVMTAHPQAAHDYQFRLRLVVDDSEFANRELTASIHVATVTESGTGTVLTNNVKVKWTTKE